MVSAVDYGLPTRDSAEFGSAYQVSEELLGVDTLSNPAVDHATMSVYMRISTDAVDRERMVVRQEGIDISLYRINPVVLYGHGEDGIVLPVAVSEDPQGNCTVTLEEDGTYARAYHKSNNKISSQIFDAVACGLLRASSVGITPKEVSYRLDSRKRKVPVVDACYLNEWSYCSVGVNPESVIVKSLRNKSGYGKLLEAYALQCAAAEAILERNTLDGSPILPEIRKSLMSLVPKSGAYTGGFNFRETGKMTKSLTRQQVKRMSTLQLAKSMTKMLDYDMDTQKMFGEEVEDRESSEDVEDVADTETQETEEDEGIASGPDDMPVDSEDATETTETSGGQKPGSTVIHKIHSDLKSLVSSAEAAIAPIENPGVVKEIGKEIETMRDCMLRIEGIHDKLYSDQPKLTTEEPDVTEDMVKSWLASDTRRQVQLAAIAGRVAGWARRLQKGEVEPAQIAKSLSRTASDLNRIHELAKDESSVDENLVARFEAVEKGIGKIMSILDKTPA
jgi:hypothetical protein